MLGKGWARCNELRPFGPISSRIPRGRPAGQRRLAFSSEPPTHHHDYKADGMAGRQDSPRGSASSLRPALQPVLPQLSLSGRIPVRICYFGVFGFILLTNKFLTAAG